MISIILFFTIFFGLLSLRATFAPNDETSPDPSLVGMIHCVTAILCVILFNLLY